MPRRSEAHAAITLPMATGVFFGAITVLLVRWGAGDAPALAMGLLVGLTMFTAHALAIHLVQTRRAQHDPTVDLVDFDD